MNNPELQAIGSWDRYQGLGTQAELATSNPELQAGSWARYLGLGTG